MVETKTIAVAVAVVAADVVARAVKVAVVVRADVVAKVVRAAKVARVVVVTVPRGPSRGM